jgi:hypothetical protein
VSRGRQECRRISDSPPRRTPSRTALPGRRTTTPPAVSLTPNLLNRAHRDGFGSWKAAPGRCKAAFASRIRRSRNRLVRECGCMPENGEGLETRVHNWLRSEGYPTEMRAAAILRAAGFAVRQGQHYTDPETGKSREIDVVCRLDDELGVGSFRLIAECKLSTKPWIVFTSEWVLAEYNRFAAYALMSEQARSALVAIKPEREPQTHKAILERMFSAYGLMKGEGGLFDKLDWFAKGGRVGYSATVAFSDRGNEVPYTAALNVTKASLFAELTHNPGHLPPIMVTFPLLIVDGPLFECYLDDSGDTKLAQVSECELLFASRVGQEHTGMCIRVVTLDNLPQFALSAVAEIGKLKALLEPALKAEWDAVLARTGSRDQQQS